MTQTKRTNKFFNPGQRVWLDIDMATAQKVVVIGQTQMGIFTKVKNRQNADGWEVMTSRLSPAKPANYLRIALFFIAYVLYFFPVLAIGIIAVVWKIISGKDLTSCKLIQKFTQPLRFLDKWSK